MRAEHRASWASAWQAMAMRPGPMAWALRPLSWLYGMAVSIKRTAHRRGWLRTERLDVPVIVVGNVVVGGAGKTPAVIALVQALRDAGWSPGVISRGHGRAPSPAPLPVLPNTPARWATSLCKFNAPRAHQFLSPTDESMRGVLCAWPIPRSTSS